MSTRNHGHSESSSLPDTEMCLEALPAQQRADYEAVVLGDQTPTEHARTRGVYPSTVVENLNSAESRLREYIAEIVGTSDKTNDGYPVTIKSIGGRDADGSPTYLGKWTFDCDPVRDIVHDHLTGRVLNATAGQTRLDYQGGEIVTNGINPKIQTDYTQDVLELDAVFPPRSFQSIILDPPFDPGQADKVYEGWHAKNFAAARRTLATLTAPGGLILEFGWNSHSIADAVDGWEHEALYLFKRGPNRPDVFLTVDRKYQLTLSESLPSA